MSRYINALKTTRPEHLYVLDVDRASLDGGSVTDLGWNPTNAVVVEDTGFAELEPVPSYVDGMSYNVKFNVLHDVQVNNPANYDAHLTVAGVAGEYFGSGGKNNWTMETVFVMGDHRRSRFDDTADFVAKEGLSIERSGDGWVVVYRVDTVSGIVEVGRSIELEPYSVIHAAVIKSGSSFALLVNGVPSGGATVDDLLPAADSTLYIGGEDSQFHSDSVIASFALIDYSDSTENIKARYELISTPTNYELTLFGMSPDVVIDIDELTGTGTLEPQYRKISDGADSADFYEDENGTLRLQTSVLAPSVTKSKTLEFDLTELTEGVRTHLDITATTDANSSIVVNYSFDDVSYSVWAEGADQIPELDADWGGVI